MRQRSTTWQSPVTLEVIQFDFGKGKGQGMHPRELKDGIFHSRFQPHRPSHCPPNTPDSYPPLCRLLSAWSIRPLDLPGVWASASCRWPLLRDFPFHPSQVSCPTPVSPTTRPILFSSKGLISTWKYDNCCSSQTGYLPGTGDKSCRERKVTVQNFLFFFLSAI